MSSQFLGQVNRSTGLSIKVYKPLLCTDCSYITYTIDDNINSWSHEVNAFGGFGNASFSFAASEDDIGDWLNNGLGRHVVGYGRGIYPIYEGYVNVVKVGFGGVVYTRGPLHDIANRVSIMYTPIIEVAYEPIRGVQTETVIAEDTASQAKYGIIEKVYSGGDLVDDGTINEADELRDLYLEELKEPITDEDLQVFSSSSAPIVTIDCGGYFDWFNVYIYNLNSILSTTVTDKLEAVVTADPNNLFPTGFTHIGSNLNLTKEGDTENRTAMTIIKELVGLGGGSADRWTFGVYEDREVYFSQIPYTPEYRHSIREGMYVERIGKQKLDLWDVRPGKWIYLPDVPQLGSMSLPPVVAVSSTSVMRLDPRFMFIESVKYTAPHSLQLTGSRTGKLTQRLAQLGIGGAS